MQVVLGLLEMPMIIKQLPNRCFETPYALLNHMSPSYSISFGNLLLKKSEHMQTQDNDINPSV